MASQMELTKLCKKIKGLIPSKHVEEDATDPYQSFLKDLVTNNIDPHEVECIKRAHNYFNFILNSNDLVSLDSGRRDTVADSISRPNVGSSASNVESSASKPSVIPKLNTDEERLQLLIELYLAKDDFKEMKDKALLDMKNLSDSIRIPDSKLSEDELIKAFGPFVAQLSGQVEKAKELNKYIPCPSLIEATNEVLKEAKGIKSEEDSHPKDSHPKDTKIETEKQKLRKTLDVSTKESIINIIKNKQAIVIEEFKKLK